MEGRNMCYSSSTISLEKTPTHLVFYLVRSIEIRWGHPGSNAVVIIAAARRLNRHLREYFQDTYLQLSGVVIRRHIWEQMRVEIKHVGQRFRGWMWSIKIRAQADKYLDANCTNDAPLPLSVVPKPSGVSRFSPNSQLAALFTADWAATGKLATIWRRWGSRIPL